MAEPRHRQQKATARRRPGAGSAGATSVLVVVKGIGQLLGRWPKRGVDRETGDGHQDGPNRNDQNCCRFHVGIKFMSAVPYTILQNIKKSVATNRR